MLTLYEIEVNVARIILANKMRKSSSK